MDYTVIRARQTVRCTLTSQFAFGCKLYSKHILIILTTTVIWYMSRYYVFSGFMDGQRHERDSPLMCKQ